MGGKASFLPFLLFLALVYIYVSFIEWFTHKYIMHGLGTLGKFFKGLGLSDSHITHHTQTSLGQTLIGPYEHDSLIFNLKEQAILFTILVTGGTLIWHVMGRPFDYTLLLITLIILSGLHFWLWASFHTSYHDVYFHTDEPLTNPHGETISVFGVLDHQNTRKECNGRSSLWCSFFRYLAWYHTLHHLNKGENKPNLNVMLPGADFFLNTYKSIVDNRDYFNKNKPKNKQEQWLYHNQVFEVKVDTHSVVLYKRLNESEKDWKPLPIDI